MKIPYRVIVPVLLVVFIGTALNFSILYAKSDETTRVEGEVIVQIKGVPGIQVLKVPNGTEVISAREITADPDVLLAQPNYTYNATLLPNDPHFDKEDNLIRIKAPQAWDITTGSPDIIAAFIDSGIDFDHDDLKDNIWTNTKETAANAIDDDGNGYVDDIHGWDFVNNTSNVKPDNGPDCLFEGVNHGTVVAGIAAASGNNGVGLAGVAWKGKIMMLKALNCRGQGSTASIVRAIDYAILNGASVINMSFVGAQTDALLNQAIARAYNHGLNIVAASGNDGVVSALTGNDLDHVPSYPVCIDGDMGENYVIGVGSINNEDAHSFFSNYGSRCIDISAPGENLMSTQVHEPEWGGEYVYRYRNGWDGTSMSAPQVTGAIMLLRSLGPGLSNSEIVSILKKTADPIDSLNPGFEGKLGAGRLNVQRAILEAKLVLAKHATVSTSPGKGINTQAPYTKNSIVVAAPNAGDALPVNVFTISGQAIGSLYPYGKSYKGGILATLGDVDGDGYAELIITKQGVSNGEIRVYNASLHLINSFLPFGAKYRGGVVLYSADLDGNGKAEIVVAPTKVASTLIRVLNGQGKVLSQFFAFGKSERLVLSLGSIDLGQDGRREIMVSAIRQSKPTIVVFNELGENVLELHPSIVDPITGVNSLSVLGTDVTGDGKDDIVMAYGQGSLPYVKIINKEGQDLTTWLAFPRGYRGGVGLGEIDANGDGVPEIVVGAENKGGPMIRILNPDGSIVRQWWGFPSTLRHGLLFSTY